MAKSAAGAKAAPSGRKFGLADLGRLTLWAFCSAFALTVTAYAATTAVGQHRIKLAFAEIHDIFFPSGKVEPKPLDAVEGQQLAQEVRALTADREKLLKRVAALEHQLGDVTGSVARVEKLTRAAEQTASAPANPAPTTAPAPLPDAMPDDVTASASPPAPPVPLPVPAPSRPEYGLDLGSAANVEALRALWATALRRYSTLLDGLRPVVQMRERGRPGMDLHLVVGPIPNAATAARLCATITAAGAVCQPATFEGQRLALR